jgi:hypothetical protein
MRTTEPGVQELRRGTKEKINARTNEGVLALCRTFTVRTAIYHVVKKPRRHHFPILMRVFRPRPCRMKSMSVIELVFIGK